MTGKKSLRDANDEQRSRRWIHAWSCKLQITNGLEQFNNNKIFQISIYCLKPTLRKLSFWNWPQLRFGHDELLFLWIVQIGSKKQWPKLSWVYNSNLYNVAAALLQLRALGPYTNTVGLDPAKGMLDVGVEEGRYTETLHQYFHKDSGLDPSK